MLITPRASFRTLAPLGIALLLSSCATAAAVSGRGSGGGGSSIRSTPIAVGSTASGRLEDSDATLADNSKADQYTFTGRRGDKVTITMNSTAFDAFLLLGSYDNNRWTELRRDDDGGSGTNARISLELPANGVYAIRANSLSASDRGAYTLQVAEGLATVATSVARVATPLMVGVLGNGTLETSDMTLQDDTKADDWTFSGKAGDKVTVTMRSSAFDTYLLVGRTTGGRFSSIERDDDAAGGTDSRVSLTLPNDGDYTVRANAVTTSGRGAYTLLVESSAMPAAVEPMRTPNPAVVDIRREVGATLRLDNVFFDVGRATLRPESSAELDRLVGWMRENATAEIEISGHTDNTGVAETNRTLSEARAKAVVDYVIKAGISFTRITGRGFGAERPSASNDTEEGRQRNRRVEVRITKI